MKRLKFNIIYLLGLLVLMASIITVFAAFVFYQTTTVNTDLGNITINSQDYVIYANNHSYQPNDSRYNKIEKLREDTVATIDDIDLNNAGYKKTNDEAIVTGKTYYIYSDDSYTAVAEPNSANLGDYYELVATKNGIKSATGYYFDESTEGKEDFVDLDIEVSGTNSNTLSFSIGSDNIEVTCAFSNDGVESATVTPVSKKYKAVIGVDGLSMVIIDTTKTATSGRTEEADGRIICSATASKNPTGGDRYYLSQIGFQFSFTSEIACYVRIHIQDAWTRTRVYTSNSKQVYEMKDQIGGKSPFTVTDNDWVYQDSTNCIYLKTMYDPNEMENGVYKYKNSDGTYKPQSYTFNVNEAYYYSSLSSGVYNEYVDVEVSFTVDVVQANRVKALWGFDPNDVTNNN